MTPYIYPILTRTAQAKAHQPYIHPDALPLYHALNMEIEKIGSRKLTAEWILLENQEIFGFRETEIKARIRSFQRKKIEYPSPFRWSDHEIKILKDNPNKTARQISAMINRTIVAIQFKRQDLNKPV